MNETHLTKEEVDAILLEALSNGGERLHQALLKGEIAVSRVVEALPTDLRVHFEPDGTLRGDEACTNALPDDRYRWGARALDLRTKLIDVMSKRTGRAASQWPTAWVGTVAAMEVHRLALSAVSIAVSGRCVDTSIVPFEITEEVVQADVTRLWIVAGQLLVDANAPYGNPRRSAALSRRVVTWAAATLEQIEQMKLPGELEDPTQGLLEEQLSQLRSLATLLVASGDPSGPRLRALLSTDDSVTSVFDDRKTHAESLLDSFASLDEIAPYSSVESFFLAIATVCGWGDKKHVGTFLEGLESMRVRAQAADKRIVSSADRLELALTSLGHDPKPFLGALRERERKQRNRPGLAVIPTRPRGGPSFRELVASSPSGRGAWIDRAPSDRSGADTCVRSTSVRRRGRAECRGRIAP